MSLKHKYRIIGVVVLLIALIILLPSFFHQREHMDNGSFSAIPSEPLQPVSTEANPESDVTTQSLSTEQSEPISVPTSSDNPSKVTLTQGFVIQLGSFMQLHNIDEIKAKLSLLNYHVYTIPTVPVAGKVTRVLVGPYPTKDQAEAAQQAIQQEIKLQGKLIKFNPITD